MFKLKTSGFEGVMAMLRNVAEKVPENARKTMHRGADTIVREAKLNAPVDKHNLEESIRKEVNYTGLRRRLSISIVAGGQVNGVDVDEYAMEVHENYDDARPGPGTAAKRDANPGRQIGSHYLTRAVEDQKAKLEKAVIQAVVIGSKG
ncbi:HK97 gp10 family phage protein [Methylobacterium sp. AMS5]|uniref:HK97 gp10 family phage protein n=1 Tax=Methylobacterium sp. AMS5 TaxID=925818 RepID=UPI00074F9905|nr:HK97 gp10 family phage protein [Methylobacterium sp. AMS5]AMB48264.1 hypothetical protein Y590_25185 [Methylobacterium sp. AMS5]